MTLAGGAHVNSVEALGDLGALEGNLGHSDVGDSLCTEGSSSVSDEGGNIHSAAVNDLMLSIGGQGQGSQRHRVIRIGGVYEYYDRKIPDYYDTMYRDGYSPEQILHSARRKILREYEARKAERLAEAEAMEIPEVKITSEVRIK